MRGRWIELDREHLQSMIHRFREVERTAKDNGLAFGEAMRSLAGARWLHLLAKLGLGACLADNMGLGKTIQVLSLLLVLKRQDSAKPRPSLLAAPAGRSPTGWRKSNALRRG